MLEVKVVNELLSSEDIFTNALLFEKRWNQQLSISDTKQKVAEIVDTATLSIKPDESDADNLDSVLDLLYGELMFSSTCQPIPESLLLSPSYGVYFRTGDEVTLGIIISHILNSLSFDSSLVIYQESIHLHVKISDSEYFLIEPASGMQERFIEVENESKLIDTRPYETISSEGIFKMLLGYQKMAFMDEGLLSQALCCVDLLMQLSPEDPYERRDRGFLLQQLDCYKVACADFEFFIEKCPQDPVADIMKLQLADMKRKRHILH
ncbi:tetratricopeptide repeat protein [Flocculibacter collagenilyticus]|uniref:tetratricopeptide repeat protein n=1 Tax=Flocculibacter collagenilyticus TaxID=2744479 RepID=UPI0018F774A9|nr:tetratricopeptide repeat protein [Flocculibacter collagenilyticus]